MHLPMARGPLTKTLFEMLPAGRPGASEPPQLPGSLVDPLDDEDLQLALWCLYELHYQGFDDVDDQWEWAPELLGFRASLEAVFEGALRELASEHVEAMMAASGGVADRLFDLTGEFDGPELSKYVRTRADLDQVREFLVHRSIYHLKEADPHTWVIPRVTGPAKAHLVELQYDEYGDGQPGRVHQRLFALTMSEAGLDPEYGAYADVVPAQTFAISNAMSLFGLHRRLRGASMGHLGAFEATSSLPCRRYAGGLRRVGLSDQAALYFDEHVEADAVHEQLALRGICEQMANDDPSITEDIAFGAATCLVLEARLADRLIGAWSRGGHLVEPPRPELRQSA